MRFARRGRDRFVSVGGRRSRRGCEAGRLRSARPRSALGLVRFDLLPAAAASATRLRPLRLGLCRSETWRCDGLRVRCGRGCRRLAASLWRPLEAAPSFVAEQRRLLPPIPSAISKMRLPSPARASPPAARTTMSAAAPLAVRFVFFLALGKRLFLEQRLTVGDRNLVVVRMNFGKSEEAVAIAAIVDEGGLQRRLDAGHFREIDVAAQRPFIRRFEVELFDAVTSQHHHPGFFRVGGVDDHFVCHEKLSRGAREVPPTAEKRSGEPRAAPVLEMGFQIGTRTVPALRPSPQAAAMRRRMRNRPPWRAVQTEVAIGTSSAGPRREIGSSQLSGAMKCADVTNWSAPPRMVRLVASIFQSAKSLFGRRARAQERRLRRRAKTRHGVIR